LFGSLRRLREFRNHQTYEAFIPLFQLRELPAKALDLAPFTERQFSLVEVHPFDLLWLGFTIVENLIERYVERLCVLRKVSMLGTVWPFSTREV
jgi:hypothetical protein